MAKKTINKKEGDQSDLEEQIDIAEGKADLKVEKAPKKSKRKKGERKSLMEEFSEDEEVKELIARMRKRREELIDEAIEKHLDPEDFKKLQQWKELYVYLFEKGRLEYIERGDNFDTKQFGIKIYGDEYWFSEKDVTAY